MIDPNNASFLKRTIADTLLLIAEKTTSLGPDIGRYDPGFFLSPKLFVDEKENIFRRMPLMMGFSGEIANPGDARAENICGVPVFLIRGKDGKARAFLNACRHRGAQLVPEPCVKANARLTCPYHLWSYGLDGRLLAIQEHHTFGEIDKSELGLIELPCQEKYGLIYIALSQGIEIDIDKILGDHAPIIANWNFEESSFVMNEKIETRINWKIALDTYCENYHFTGAHRDSLALNKINNCTPIWRFGELDRNHILTFPEKKMAELVGSDPEGWGDGFNYLSYIYYLFPHTIISIFPTQSLIYRVFPGETVDSCVTMGTAIARSRSPDEETITQVKATFGRVNELIKTEDYPQGLASMAAIKSGLYPGSLFGRNEHAITGMHDAIRHAASSHRS